MRQWTQFFTPQTQGAQAAYLREYTKIIVTMQRYFTSKQDALQFKPVCFPEGQGLSRRAKPIVADYSVEELTAHIGPKSVQFYKAKVYLEFPLEIEQ